MKLLKAIARVHPKSLASLIGLGFRNPLFLYPTFVATKECLHLATLHFGRLHYQNTPANAFRHALWNYLIALKCRKWCRTDNGALLWTKTITDWHEDAFRNREMARKMDLHNNAVGRTIFKRHRKESKEAIITLFIQMTKKSLKMKPGMVLQDYSNTLVHMID